MKNIVVYQLPFPRDVVDYMCSFIYYTEEQAIVRHKHNYNKVVYDLFYTIRLVDNFYFDLNQSFSNLNIYNLQSKFDIQFDICCKCGNYIYPFVNCKCI